MSEDRSWMYRRWVDKVISADFKNGVDRFIQFALRNHVQAVDCDGKIRCPCVACKNLKWLTTWDVQTHLYRKGFVEGYTVWLCHGELFCSQQPANVGGSSSYVDMVKDAAKMKTNRAAQPEKNLHTDGSVSFATHKARLETQLKRPAHFQEVFNVTHKKKRTDEYIPARVRETAESYGTRMEEKYGDKDQQPELDPELWVEASGGAKKGHVYGFGHTLGSSKVLSSCASAASHATSPFATPAAPSGGSSPAPTMTPEQIKEVVQQAVTEIMSQGFSQMMSQAFSQMMAHTSHHPPGAISSQQHQDGPSVARGADDLDDDAA